jgi:ATP-binding cassette subfamily F protein 3
MERRLKELDDLLMKPENASNMEFVTEYTSTKKALDEEVERWERLSEDLESLNDI